MHRGYQDISGNQGTTRELRIYLQNKRKQNYHLARITKSRNKSFIPIFPPIFLPVASCSYNSASKTSGCKWKNIYRKLYANCNFPRTIGRLVKTVSKKTCCHVGKLEFLCRLSAPRLRKQASLLALKNTREPSFFFTNRTSLLNETDTSRAWKTVLRVLSEGYLVGCERNRRRPSPR